MKKINKFLSALLGVAFVGLMLTSCESDKSPLTDNTKLWPAFTKDKKTGKKHGYINEKGEWVISPRFDRAYTFSSGVALVAVRDEEEGGFVYSYIDKKGNVTGSFKSANQHYCGLALASVDGETYSYVDASATPKIYSRHESCSDFSDDFAKFYDNSAAAYGFINKKGEEEISAFAMGVYSDVDDFYEGLAVVEVDGKYGFIDKKGKQAIECKFDRAWGFSDGMSIYKRGSKYGFINKKGEEVVFAMYDAVNNFFENGLAPVEQNGKYGYINKKGEIKIQPMYDCAYSFCEGMAMVEMKGKIGFIDTKGNLVIQPKYIRCFSSPYFHNGLIGVIEETNRGVIYSYINKKGESVWSLSDESYDYEDDEDYGDEEIEDDEDFGDEEIEDDEDFGDEEIEDDEDVWSIKRSKLNNNYMLGR